LLEGVLISCVAGDSRFVDVEYESVWYYTSKIIGFFIVDEKKLEKALVEWDYDVVEWDCSVGNFMFDEFIF